MADRTVDPVCIGKIGLEVGCKLIVLAFRMCLFIYHYYYAVAPLTTIIHTSVNQTYDRGDIAVLSCISLGGPDNTYQWQANDTDISGEIMENYSVADVDASAGGVYTCVVTNAAGSDADSTFLFIASYFVVEPINQEVANGSLVTLTCIAEAFPSPNYLWARTDTMPIREELITNTSSLIFDPVLFGDEGDYYCNATSREEVAKTQDATLTGNNYCIIAMQDANNIIVFFIMQLAHLLPLRPCISIRHITGMIQPS